MVTVTVTAKSNLQIPSEFEESQAPHVSWQCRSLMRYGFFVMQSPCGDRW